MAEGQDTARTLISVTVKSTKDKKTVEIGEDAEIKEVNSPGNPRFQCFASHPILVSVALLDDISSVQCR